MDAAGLGKTFDVAQSTAGNVYVTSNSTNRVYEFDQKGSHIATLGSDATTVKPLGIAGDSRGDVWVSASGVVDIPCTAGLTGENGPPARSGYFFDGLQRNTGVQIDASGNVWLTNNWKKVPSAKTGPYGDGLVVFLGMAEPIAMPLIGTPTATAADNG